MGDGERCGGSSRGRVCRVGSAEHPLYFQAVGTEGEHENGVQRLRQGVTMSSSVGVHQALVVTQDECGCWGSYGVEYKGECLLYIDAAPGMARGDVVVRCTYAELRWGGVTSYGD